MLADRGYDADWIKRSRISKGPYKHRASGSLTFLYARKR
jgi:hypothetical protein